MPHSLRRDPVVRRVLTTYVLARLPASAIWLSVLLDVSGASGSYARAGGAVAAYGLGVALLAPLVGRAADRHGARLVLSACLVVQLPALLLLAAAAGRSGPALLLPALVAGAVQPPVVPCMRAAWSRLVPDERQRERCFSLEAVLGEAIDLAAPLLAVAVNVAAGAGGSLPWVAAATAVTTALYVVALPRSQRQDPAVVRRSWLVPAPVTAVLLVVLMLTAGLGAVEVGVVAVADRAGGRASAGVLLGLFTATSMLGGVLHARWTWRRSPRSQLVLLLAPLTVFLLASGWAPGGLVVTGVLLALAGTAVAPLVALLLAMLQAGAAEGAETTTFTWATTANYVGVAAGSLLAGVVGDAVRTPPGPGAPGLAVAGLLCAATAALAALTLRRDAPPADPPPAGASGAGDTGTPQAVLA